jgi:hypothetical protein
MIVARHGEFSVRSMLRCKWHFAEPRTGSFYPAKAGEAPAALMQINQQRGFST